MMKQKNKKTLAIAIIPFKNIEIQIDFKILTLQLFKCENIS